MGLTTIKLGGRDIQVDATIADRLLAANDAKTKATGTPITINEGFRSYERQADLYSRSQRGEIGRAAPPGKSFHETGRAVDVQDWEESQPYLNSFGLRNDLAGDKGHFSFGETKPISQKFSNFDFRVNEARQKGKSDTDIVNSLIEKVPELSQALQNIRNRYGVDKTITNDRDLVNTMAVKYSGKMPTVESRPHVGRTFEDEPTIEEEEKGAFGRFKDFAKGKFEGVKEGFRDIKEIGTGSVDVIKERGAEFPKILGRLKEGEQGLTSTQLQISGEFAAMASGVFGEVMIGIGKTMVSQDTEDDVKEKIESLMVDTGALEAMQKGQEKWGEFKENNPLLAENIEAVANIAEFGADMFSFKAGGAVKKSAKKVLDEAIDTTRKSIGGKGRELVKKADVLAPQEKRGFLEDLVEPIETKKIGEKKVARTKIVRDRLGLKKKVADLSPNEKRIVDALENVEGLDNKKLVQENYNIIKDANEKAAIKLEADIKANDFIVSRKEVKAKLRALSRDLSVSHPTIVGDVKKTADNLIENMIRFVDDNPGNGSGLFKARKEYDKWVLGEKPRAFDAKTENTFAIANREIRKLVNDLIDSRVVDVEVKDSLKFQNNLYKALDNIKPKANLEADSALQRLLQKSDKILGTKNRAVQAIAAIVGVGGLGAASTFATPAAILIGSGLLVRKGAKFVASARFKKMLGNLLLEIEKKLPSTSGAGKIELNSLKKEIEDVIDGKGDLMKKLADYIKNIQPGLSLVDVTKKKIVKSPLGESKIVVDKEVAKTLRGTKGMTADDIMKKHPNIKLKRDVAAKDIHGNKVTIPEGEALTPYELKGNKVLLQDGETYIVNKNQFENIKGQSIKGEAKPFAPELKELEETVRGGQDLEARIDSLLDDEVGQGMSRQEAKDFILQDAEDVVATKFSDYQLPGGENYREIIIQAPNSESILKSKGYTMEMDMSGEAIIMKGDKVIDFNELPKEIQNSINKQGEFISSHFPEEPNPISHLRMKEYNTSKNGKVTFMEELQSDWASEGRSKGFLGKEKAEFDSYSKSLKEKYNTTNPIQSATPEEVAKWDKLLKSESGVPFHPLVKGNKWQEPTIKRALKEAVDNDSKYFSWITGEQTSARYNLAKQIDDVSWKKSAKEAKSDKAISIIPESENWRGTSNSINLNIDKNGKILVADTPDWVGKKLDEVLGKGLADSIMAKETGKLSGEGLKFGGEWANNLYDRQVKNIVEDLTGGKVEKIDLGLPIEKEARQWYETLGQVKTIDLGLPVEKEAKRFILGDDINHQLKKSDLKVGEEITQETINQAPGYRERGSEYIITDVLGDGKFKAVEKEVLNNLYQVLPEKERLKNFIKQKEVTSKYEKAFDISTKKTDQQAIKLTPEIKAKIKGEAPEIKTSGKMFEEASKNPLGKNK